MARVLLYKPTTPPAGEGVAPTAGPGGKPKSDEDYADKLVKYIPGEAIAFYTPLALLVKDSGIGAQLALILVGAVGVILYTGYHARRQKSKGRVLVHFYVFSVIAFLLWSSNTTPTFAAAIHFDQVPRTIALAAATFLFPALDDWLASKGI
jgi:hypothetical protein